MNKSGGVECLAWTWGVATLGGLFTATMLWVLGGWTFMQGAFMGVLFLLILGAILTIMMCRGSAASPAKAGAGTGASAYVASGIVSPPAAGTSTKASDKASEASAKAEADRATAAKAKADRAAAAAAAKVEADSAKAKAAAPAAPAAAAAPAEATGSGTRPEALDGPRGGTADDLKRIKGVGPKMETMCNDLGFYHFDQIANWTADEVAWVDQNLKGFKGRVTRDAWVDQARLLAAGGETDFSKKVDGGDVY